MRKVRRIRITHIHKTDGHYPHREGMIGLEGEFRPWPEKHYPGYYCGQFVADKTKRYLFFLGVRYRRI